MQLNAEKEVLVIQFSVETNLYGIKPKLIFLHNISGIQLCNNRNTNYEFWH